MPPVADQASLFRGRLPISGYKVSADWLEPTVYPLLGFPRTPFTRKGDAASVNRHSRDRLPYLTVADNLLLYRQCPPGFSAGNPDFLKFPLDNGNTPPYNPINLLDWYVFVCSEKRISMNRMTPGFRCCQE